MTGGGNLARLGRGLGLAGVLALLVGAAPAAAQAVSFQGPTNFRVGGYPESVAVGDFNADSDPDLAVANADSDSVSVLLGGAGASFGAKTKFAAGDFPYSVGVGDFNADSDPDLAVANADSDSVSVLLGSAGGSFGAKTKEAGPAPENPHVFKRRLEEGQNSVPFTGTLGKRTSRRAATSCSPAPETPPARRPSA